jgi:hypothetical protein
VDKHQATCGVSAVANSTAAKNIDHGLFPAVARVGHQLENRPRAVDVAAEAAAIRRAIEHALLVGIRPAVGLVPSTTMPGQKEKAENNGSRHVPNGYGRFWGATA